MASYLQLRGRVYYYVREIPADLRPRFGGKVTRRESLRTSDEQVAARLASKMAAEDDALWKAMRGDASLTPAEVTKAAQALIDEYQPTEWREDRGDGSGEFSMWSKWNVLDTLLDGDPLQGTVIQTEANRILKGEKTTPYLRDALDVYLKEHRNRGDKHFEKVTRLGLDLVFLKLGDRPMDNYSRQEVLEWRDELLKTTKTATFKRRLDSINAVFRKACAEFQLILPNPFEKLTIHGDGLDSEKREPYTLAELASIKKAVEAKNDDMRWIIGLQIETGARLGEIVGLRSDDLRLNHPVPHMKIRPHLSLGRRLKNKQSERDVPLVGVSLWSAQQALKASPKGWLFPRYAANHDIRATYASNTLVKWLKRTVSREAGIGNHSFRHSMLDRLRDSGCPEPVAQQIVGHGPQTITRGYGKGYALETLVAYLDQAKLPN
jgi:integrase